MASSLSSKLTQLSLVLLVATLFTFSAYAHKDAVTFTYTLRGHLRNLLNPRANVSCETFYMTKTPNRLDLLLTPLAGDRKSNQVHFFGVIAPYISSSGSNDRVLQPFMIEGILNSSYPIGDFVTASSRLGTYIVRGNVFLTCDSSSHISISGGMVGGILDNSDSSIHNLVVSAQSSSSSSSLSGVVTGLGDMTGDLINAVGGAIGGYSG